MRHTSVRSRRGMPRVATVANICKNPPVYFCLLPSAPFLPPSLISLPLSLPSISVRRAPPPWSALPEAGLRAPPPARLLAGDRVPVAHHLAPPTRSRRCHEGRRTQPPRAPVRGKETGRARRARPRPPLRPPWLGTEHRAEGSSRPLTGRRLHLGAMASSCSCPGRGAPPGCEPAAAMARARRRGARSPTGLGGASSRAAAEGEGGWRMEVRGGRTGAEPSSPPAGARGRRRQREARQAAAARSSAARQPQSSPAR